MSRLHCKIKTLAKYSHRCGLRSIEIYEFCLKKKQEKKLTRNICDIFYHKMIETKYGVYKSSLMDLKLLPGNAGDNKAQAAKAGSVNVASGKTLKKDAVL